MSSLITQFARRIEKYFIGNARPKVGTPDTNHRDNPELWAGNEIYKGELILNLETGKAYTSDGTEIIEVNSENGIISGMQVRVPDGMGQGQYGTPFWLTVNSGIIRTEGKLYYHTSVTDENIGDIQVEPNLDDFIRIDLIYAVPESTVLANTELPQGPENEYHARIDILTGNSTNGMVGDSAINNILQGSYREELELQDWGAAMFLGFVIVPPQYTQDSEHLLRPHSVVSFDKPTVFETCPEDFIRQIQCSIDIYNDDSSYVENQVVVYKGTENQIYLTLKTHYSKNITTSIYGGKMNQISGGGGGQPPTPMPTFETLPVSTMECYPSADQPLMNTPLRVKFSNVQMNVGSAISNPDTDGVVTINEDGVYLITYKIKFDKGSAKTYMRLSTDGGNTFTKMSRDIDSSNAFKMWNVTTSESVYTRTHMFNCYPEVILINTDTKERHYANIVYDNSNTLTLTINPPINGRMFVMNTTSGMDIVYNTFVVQLNAGNKIDLMAQNVVWLPTASLSSVGILASVTTLVVTKLNPSLKIVESIVP